MDKNHVFEQLFHTSLKGQKNKKKDVFSNIPAKFLTKQRSISSYF
jgi:hypothetical protein